MDFKALSDILKPFCAEKTELLESWGYLTIKGAKKGIGLDDFEKLDTFFSSLNNPNAFSIKIDGDEVSHDDLKDFLSNNTSFNNWELNINKSTILFKNSANGLTEIFFITLEKLEEWLSKLDPFDKENPFHKFGPLVIFTEGISQPLIGQAFQILPFGAIPQINNNVQYNLPKTNDINKIVHVISSKEVIINPAQFVFTASTESELEKKLYKLAMLTLAASIVNELYSVDKITIDGIKRIELKLFEDSDSISKVGYQNLIKLISWIYEEKVTTRQKLFADRITLELDETKSLVSALSKHLETSLLQAQQRYNFVILERKDKYIAELKDLLKDIRNQSDLYSQKIRALLNNLLRDVLAAIVLVGFTLFTKFSDNALLNKELLLTYVFNGLAIYYLISIVFQAVVDWIDINVSKKEILYWKNTSKELLPEKEFKFHINKSLKGRKISLWIIYPLIALMYLSVAYTCYRFPGYFKKISTEQAKTDNDKISKHTTPKDSCSQSRK